MDKNNLITENKFCILDESTLLNIPKEKYPDQIGFMFIPLLKVSINNIDTILMKPSIGGWQGYTIENIRFTIDSGNQEIKNIIKLKNKINKILKPETDDWQNKLNELFNKNFEKVNFDIKNLKSNILRDFGKDNPDDIILEPFSSDAYVFYMSLDDSFKQRILYITFFLKLIINTEDLSFFEYRSLEYIPIEFFYHNINLNPRYSLHIAVKGFFKKYGTGFNKEKNSLVDKIPRVVWEAKKYYLNALTFAADFSFYYENRENKKSLIEAFFKPNPESNEEKLFHEIIELTELRLSNEEFGKKFLSLIDNYITVSLLKSGMFIKTNRNGHFYGMVEESSLIKNEKDIRKFSIYALIDIIRFIKKAKIIIDFKKIETAGPEFDDPERWFNMRRDILPFDYPDEMIKMRKYFDEAGVPITKDDYVLNFKKNGLILTSKALNFIGLNNFIFSEKGKVHDKIKNNELYYISKDDSIVGLLPFDQENSESNYNFYIWRVK